MRIALAAFLAIALAGCGQRPENGQNMAGAPGLPTPGARPTAPTAPTAPPAGGSAESAYDQGFRQSYRASAIASCTTGAQTRSAQTPGGPPPGTDFRPYCTCFVDRSMAGLTVQQLASLQPGAREQGIAEQCAEESGLRPGGSGGK